MVPEEVMDNFVRRCDIAKAAYTQLEQQRSDGLRHLKALCEVAGYQYSIPDGYYEGRPRGVLVSDRSGNIVCDDTVDAVLDLLITPETKLAMNLAAYGS